MAGEPPTEDADNRAQIEFERMFDAAMLSLGDKINRDSRKRPPDQLDPGLYNRAREDKECILEETPTAPLGARRSSRASGGYSSTTRSSGSRRSGGGYPSRDSGSVQGRHLSFSMESTASEGDDDTILYAEPPTALPSRGTSSQWRYLDAIVEGIWQPDGRLLAMVEAESLASTTSTTVRSGVSDISVGSLPSFPPGDDIQADDSGSDVDLPLEVEVEAVTCPSTERLPAQEAAPSSKPSADSEEDADYSPNPSFIEVVAGQEPLAESGEDDLHQSYSGSSSKENVTKTDI